MNKENTAVRISYGHQPVEETMTETIRTQLKEELEEMARRQHQVETARRPKYSLGEEVDPWEGYEG